MNADRCPHRCCKVDDADCNHRGKTPADCAWCLALPTVYVDPQRGLDPMGNSGP